MLVDSYMYLTLSFTFGKFLMDETLSEFRYLFTVFQNRN